MKRNPAGGQLVVTVACMLQFSCAAVNNSPKYELGDSEYTLIRKNEPRQKVYVHASADSIIVFSMPEKNVVPLAQPEQFFVKGSFDVDVLVAPFKYRRSSAEFPRQLNASFNGNVYVGYRADKFVVRLRDTPAGIKRTVMHTALSIGGFAGLGASPVNPWTTLNRTTDEYDGLVFTKGIAALAGINKITAGLAVGFDQLTDRDKSIWIYQHKPWYGIVIGLNLN